VRSHSRCAAAVAAIVIGCLGLGACATKHHDAPTQPQSLLIVGDSLLFQSIGSIRQSLAATNWKITSDARPGSRITGGVSIGSWPERIAQLAGVAHPDIAVVELGTNGCACTSIAAAIDADMRPLQNVPRVYWVNVRTDAPRPPDRVQIDNELEAATRRWTNLHIIDFDQRFAHHRELLIADDIHFTTAGVAAFTTLVHDALTAVK
jgi:hypothetical protein